jgi:hypothetical protein
VSWATNSKALAIVGGEHTMPGIPQGLDDGGELTGVIVGDNDTPAPSDGACDRSELAMDLCSRSAPHQGVYSE